MKILHVVYTYAPDPIGGTEVYVKQLCDELSLQGVKNAIAAPGTRVCVIRSIPEIFRYEFDKHPTYSTMYGGGDEIALAGFIKVVEDFKPDLVHFHSISSANSYLLIDFLKARNFPVVLTLHSPAIVCQRGSLLYEGKVNCEKIFDVDRCARCYLHRLTNSFVLSLGISAVSRFLKKLPSHEIKGRMNLALQMQSLMQQRINRSQKIFEAVDRIVCPAKWVMNLLLKNKISATKLVFSRQGIKVENILEQKKKNTFLRFVFLGRLEPLKGVHILLEALKKNKRLKVRLDIYAVIQFDDNYVKKIKRLVARDERVRMMAPVASDRVINLIKQYDALLVPSQSFETGPLVVLEAFAARTPVIGSELGSISELIQDNCNGFLVRNYHLASAWEKMIHEFCEAPQLLNIIKTKIQSPKTMSAVASEMLQLYSELIGKNN